MLAFITSCGSRGLESKNVIHFNMFQYEIPCLESNNEEDTWLCVTQADRLSSTRSLESDKEEDT